MKGERHISCFVITYVPAVFVFLFFQELELVINIKYMSPLTILLLKSFAMWYAHINWIIRSSASEKRSTN